MHRRTLLLSTDAAALLAGRSHATAVGNEPGVKSLNALFDRFMKENLDLSPMTVASLGLDSGERLRQKSLIDDLSEAGLQKQKALTASQLARLQGFDRGSLSRADAISFDLEVMGDQRATAVTEVERYCIVPGQACSYMLGKLEFLAGRERDRKMQGLTFDIRKYHDKVLLPGALPLDMLRRI